MKMKLLQKKGSSLAAIFTVAGLALSATAAHSALIARSSGLVYDDVLDITWGSIGPSGDWDATVAWANDLSIVYDGTVFDDWRLASMDVNGDGTIVDASSATELASRDNEYGYLGYQYGIDQGSPGVFGSVNGVKRWSGTEVVGDPLNAYAFNFFVGDKGNLEQTKTTERGGWAVRDGDVAAVPEPSSTALLGLGGLAVLLRRRR